MKPPRSILDRSFRYVPAVKTDVAATFARVRREQLARDRATTEETARVVRPLTRKAAP